MPHVLIVDDEADVRQMLQTYLSIKGFTTECAVDGAEALRRIRQARPCLIILDLVMPGMHGWAFRIEQLHDPLIADVPVVCMSGIVDRDLVEQHLHLRCLRKPLDLDELFDVVCQTCQARADC